MNTDSLLVEIGTEELPPKALQKLSNAFTTHVSEQLSKQEITHGEVCSYFTPRRLAIYIKEVIAEQPTQNIERRGPALSAAYDDEGNPSKAALGFARSCGVEIDALEKVETEKGTWLYFKSSKPGKHIQEIVPDIIEDALKNLPVPKPMRWGDNEVEFVRPVHWVVLMYGNEVINGETKGLRNGNVTYGHRFHAPAAITLKHADDYASALNNAYVIADFDQRKEKIVTLINEQAAQREATLSYEDSLLNEVTNLVEWPCAITGEFDESYLSNPQEALVATMQGDQRYFPLYSSKDNTLLPFFITIANIESSNPETIKKGNERVIKPRFEDAAFFWQRDCSNTLASRRTSLANILFEKQLGSVLDKSERVEKLAEYLCQQLSIDPQASVRAAHLCKCDLVSDMVGEFPKLQGIMGRYYALNDNESEEVANAIEEHYRPLQAGTALPASAAGQIVAIADRIDTLVGIFATGKKPTGVKDPYALRRAALGMIRITLECKLEFDLHALLEFAASLFTEKLKATDAVNEVEEFIIERLRGYLSEQGIAPDSFEAVRAIPLSSLFDFQQRIHAVSDFRTSEHAETLAAANKRIRNILKDINPAELRVEESLLSETAEKELCEQLQTIEKQVAPKVDQRKYSEALSDMAFLKTSIDNYFEHIMVMHEDLTIRNNRIALLAQVRNLFSSVADISQLQS